MLNLAAPILPGQSAAGIRLGASADSLPARRADCQVTLSNGHARLEFGPVKVWLEQEVVTQIGVCRGYTGKLAETIGIGSTIAEVESLLGPVSEDDQDNLVVNAVPGWCFETEEWVHSARLRENTASPIVEIFVYAVARP